MSFEFANVHRSSLFTGSSLMGGVFFHEFDNLDTQSLILFPISIVVTLFGVAILAYDVGAMYSNILEKLHLKRHETVNPQMAAKEQWVCSLLILFVEEFEK